MKNILQLFKKMQPKSYYEEGVAVKGCEDKKWREEDWIDETTDCRNIYSTTKSDMPIQGIGLMKARNIR